VTEYEKTLWEKFPDPWDRHAAYEFLDNILEELYVNDLFVRNNHAPLLIKDMTERDYDEWRQTYNIMTDRDGH
jgi:hypothetical protein